MNEVGSVTGKLVELALNAAQMRLEVIANNMANVNTPNYKTASVSFESQLAMHKSSILNRANDSSNLALLNNTKPEVIVSEANSAFDEEVLIDQQLMELSKVVLHYRALLDANSKRGALMKMAISGNIR